MSHLLYNACEQDQPEMLELSLDWSLLEDAAKARAHLTQMFGRELTEITEAE